MYILSRIVTRWLRLRHAIAVSDLAWMERRAPRCVAEQRARVNRLSRQLSRREAAAATAARSATHRDADMVRHQVERRAKRI